MLVSDLRFLGLGVVGFYIVFLGCELCVCFCWEFVVVFCRGC